MISPVRCNASGNASAFSLVEVLATVAVIGIVSAIAIPSVGRVVEGSRHGVAENIIQPLNKATRQFGHSQWDMRSTAVPSSGGDELLILRTLQWRDTRANIELNPPGPFMKTDWNPTTSTGVDDYRAEWTGSSWRLLEPGATGAGLKIIFDGSDLGTPYVHDPAFAPVGSR